MESGVLYFAITLKREGGNYAQVEYKSTESTTEITQYGCQKTAVSIQALESHLYPEEGHFFRIMQLFLNDINPSKT